MSNFLPVCNLSAGDKFNLHACPGFGGNDGSIDSTPSQSTQNLKGAKTELKQLLNSIGQSRIQLKFMNGSTKEPFTLSEEELMQDTLNNCDMLSESLFRDKMTSICEGVLVPQTVELLSTRMKSLLNHSSEAPCQQELNRFVMELDAVNSSGKSVGHFLHSKTLDDVECVYTLTAKADLVGKRTPGTIEIKAQVVSENCDGLVVQCYAVLVQLLWRIHTVRNTTAYIGTCVGFACSPRSAWFVEFRRDESSFHDKLNFEQIIVHRVAHAHVLPLWLAYAQKSHLNPGWYLTPTAPHLLNTLSRITDPYACCIKLHAHSTWYVYRVSLPNVFKDTDPSGRKNNVLGAAGNTPDFMIKVILTTSEYENEAAALLDVSSEYNRSEPHLHYALGVCALHSIPASEQMNALDLQVGQLTLVEVLAQRVAPPATPDRSLDEPLQYDQKVAVEHAQIFARSIGAKKDFHFLDLHNKPRVPLTQQSCIWRGVTDAYLQSVIADKGSEGGCILMRVGQPVAPLPKQVEQRRQVQLAWLKGVSRSLSATHRAKWRHCDVRPANVLIFGNTYMLVDYSLAVREGTMVKLLAGARHDHLGYGLCHLSLGAEHEWTAADDVDMAAATVLKLH